MKWFNSILIWYWNTKIFRNNQGQKEISIKQRRTRLAWNSWSQAFMCQNSRLDLDWALSSNCILAWFLLVVKRVDILAWFLVEKNYVLAILLEDILKIELFIQHIISLGFTQFKRENSSKCYANPFIYLNISVDLSSVGVFVSHWQLHFVLCDSWILLVIEMFPFRFLDLAWNWDLDFSNYQILQEM